MARFIPTSASLGETFVQGGDSLVFQDPREIDALLRLVRESETLSIRHVRSWFSRFDEWLEWVELEPASPPRRDFETDFAQTKHPENLSRLEELRFGLEWVQQLWEAALDHEELEFFVSLGTSKGLRYSSSFPALVLTQGSIEIGVTPFVSEGLFALTLGSWAIGVIVRSTMLPSVQRGKLTQALRARAKSSAKYPDIPDLRTIENLDSKAGLIVLVHGLFSTDLKTFDGFIDAWNRPPEFSKWDEDGPARWNLGKLKEQVPELRRQSDDYAKDRLESAFHSVKDDIILAGWPHDTLASIETNAVELAKCLMRLNPQIPVVFVCHSRGGLVARMTLSKIRKAKGHMPYLQRAWAFTFGTPHEGAALAESPHNLVAAYWMMVTGTRTPISIARILSAYQLEGRFRGIEDLMPDSKFLLGLNNEEMQHPAFAASLPRLIFAVGGICPSSFKKRIMTYLLGSNQHDLVVCLESSRPKNVLEGLHVNCDHGSYFAEAQLSTDEFKKALEHVRFLVQMKDLVSARARV